MKVTNKYYIGTHVMFYEIKVLREMVQSYKNAIDIVENKENITFELFFNMSEVFESIDTDQISKEELLEEFNDICNDLEKNNYPITKIIYDGNKPYTIGSYRRDLNDKGFENHDYVIWGETDCLFPKEMFYCIEGISNHASNQNINRYCITFAMRKMWDNSWSVLEHSKFTSLPFIEDLNTTEISSIWSYMDIDKMNQVNNETEDIDLQIINYPRFDGSCLVISSDLIQNGVNIPKACWACGEDTSLQTMIKLIMGDSYKQFIVKNILKAHNRNHPHKREYVKGENHMKGQSVKHKRRTNKKWNKLHKLAESNLYNLGSNQNKFNKLNQL